jgi:hypothetical protein
LSNENKPEPEINLNFISASTKIDEKVTSILSESGCDANEPVNDENSMDVDVTDVNGENVKDSWLEFSEAEREQLMQLPRREGMLFAIQKTNLILFLTNSTS